MMSSVMPSARWEWSVSPASARNGSTRDGRPLAETLHQRRARDASGCRGFTMQRDLVDADRPRDVPEVLQSQVDEDEAAVLAGRCRGFGNADAADVGDTLKPRGDIDAVAVDVVVRDDHLAQADADAKADPPFDFLGLCRSFVSVLDFGGATHGSRRIGEFDQCSVPGLLDDAAGCLGYTRLDDRLHPVPQLGVGVFLVQAHQAAVASDVHHEHCCEAPFEALRFSHSVLHRASWLGTDRPGVQDLRDLTARRTIWSRFSPPRMACNDLGCPPRLCSGNLRSLREAMASAVSCIGHVIHSLPNMGAASCRRRRWRGHRRPECDTREHLVRPRRPGAARCRRIG